MNLCFTIKKKLFKWMKSYECMKKSIKHNNKMLDYKDFEEAKKFLAEFSPEVTSFESNILTPELIGRLNYIKTVFIKFKKICSDKTVADDMDKFIRELYNLK
nr:hypothetical protein GTC16762_11540 [Pigmentibacter ruber]